MRLRWIDGAMRRRGMPAAVVAGLVSMAALAGGAGPAAASPHRVTPVPHRVTPAAAGDISAVAGGNGGPGLATTFDLSEPCGVAAGASALYVADFHSVRRLGLQDTLSQAAGTGFDGRLSFGTPATGAGLNAICVVAVDHHGNLVVADSLNARIEVVPHLSGYYYKQRMTAGDIYSVVGGGEHRRSGNRSSRFELAKPNGLAVDPAGNLVITDDGQIWVAAERPGVFYGQPMQNGHIYLVAGNGGSGFSGDGGPATQAKLDNPGALAVDAAGNILLCDTGSNRIRVVAGQTGTFYGQPMTAGDIYTVAGGGTMLGDGGPATAAELSSPQAVTVDGAGNLVIADPGDVRVRVVAASVGTFYGVAMTAGDIYTVAGSGTAGFSGDGGPATAAKLFQPGGVAVDSSGNLVIADTLNRRIRVVAASTGRFYRQPMTAGDIYTIAGKGLQFFTVDGGPATSAQFLPFGVTADSAGDTAIATPTDQRILLEAGSTGHHFGQPMTAGHLYVVAGDGHPGFSGDGGPAALAKINFVDRVAMDGNGNLVIADAGNNRIRVVAASTGTFYQRSMTVGDIYTIAGNGTAGFSGDGGPATAAGLGSPEGVTMDPAGNLVITDSGNNRIRVVAERTGTFYGRLMTAGNIYTIAGSGTAGFSGDGGPATAAELDSPRDVAVSAGGNVLISDSSNNRVRVVAEQTGTFYGQPVTAGHIYTAAQISAFGITVDSAGNALVATQAERVQVVAAATGTFYGQPMTAGDVYTIAGTGAPGLYGNGGPAIDAELSSPMGITVDQAGDVLFADSGNGQVREISG